MRSTEDSSPGRAAFNDPDVSTPLKVGAILAAGWLVVCTVRVLSKAAILNRWLTHCSMSFGDAVEAERHYTELLGEGGLTLCKAVTGRYLAEMAYAVGTGVLFLCKREYLSLLDVVW